MKSLFANERRRYFNIYDDWVFHYIFSRDTEESKQALIAVLNVILQRESDPIIDIQIKNPGFYGERDEDKDSVLDIKALTDSNEIIDIEVQNKNLSFYCDRSVYYGGRLVNSALEKGEKYDKMKKSIVISIVNGTLFPETGKLHTIFQLREIEEDIQLSDRLELHFLELGKILPNTPVDHLDSVEKLAAYLKFAGDETKEDYIQNLIQSGGDAIKMTEQLFRALTEDEIAYERNERKLKFELDRNTELSLAKKEGIEQGIEQGLEQGLEQGIEQGEELTLIKQVCRKLILGKPVSQIASDLDEDLSHIQRICAAAEGFAPDYDVQQIYEKLLLLPKE